MIELLIAVALSAFLILVTLTQNLSMFQGQMYGITRSNLSQDVLLDASYLANQIEGIGGGAVRSWMAIWEENNCAARGPLADCGGSDRITLTTAQNPPLECAIQSWALATPNQIVVANTPACCLTAAFNNKQLMLVNNNSYAQVYSTSVDLVACTLTFTGGQAAADPEQANPLATNWGNGTVSVVNVQTYYMDSTAHALNVWADANNDGAIQANESSLVATGVYDFQVALGFDLNSDHNLVDQENNTDDWLYNAAGESMGVGVFASASMFQLEMVEVGIMLGIPANFQHGQPNVALTLLDGPARQINGIDLKDVSYKVGPRNSYLFQ